MKLLHKSSLYFIALLIPIFLASGYIFHSIIHYEINEDTDHNLSDQMMNAEKNKLVAVAKTGMVCFDYSNRKVTAVPELAVAKLQTEYK